MMSEKTIYINELLCYIIHHINNSTMENISKVINYFYTCEGIYEAKKQLWTAEGTQSLGGIIERKKTAKRSASEANVDDIIEALIKLDSEDCVPCFTAKNVERLPECQPEQLNIVSIIDRLSSLEKEIKDHNKLLILHSEIVNDIKNNIKGTKQSNFVVQAKMAQNLENANTENKKINLEIDSLSCQSETNLDDQMDNSSGKENTDDVRTHNFVCGDISFLNKESPSVPVKVQIENFEREIGKNTPRTEYFNDNKNQLIDKERFILKESKNEKRRRLDENSPISLRGAPSPITSVFVGRIVEGNERSIFKYLRNINIRVQNISLISHKNSRYKSFKVSLYKNQFNEILDIENWPMGILVKPWKDLSRNSNINRQTTFFNTKHKNRINNNNNNNNNTFRY